MKKIIWILTLFIGFMSNVMAEEYIWSSQKIDNLKLIEEEKRFRYYKESFEGEYIKKGVVDERYGHEDEENVKYEINGKYKKECENNSNTICEYLTVYPYQNIYRSRYMRLWNIQDDLNIESINIYQNDKKLDFEIVECLYCDNLKIKKDGYMKIDLKDDYAPRTLKIEVKTSNTNRFLYLIAFYNIDEKKAFEIAAWSSQKTYDLKHYGFENHLLSEIKYSAKPVSDDYETHALSPKEMYIEKDIYTYRYNIVKNYYDSNYYSLLLDENYIKDEDDYMIYYKYLVSDYNDEETYDSQESNDTVFSLDYFYEEELVNTGLSEEYKDGKTIKLVKILFTYIFLLLTLVILIVLKIKNKLSN